MTSVTFTDTDGDTIQFTLAGDRVQEFVNGAFEMALHSLEYNITTGVLKDDKGVSTVPSHEKARVQAQLAALFSTASKSELITTSDPAPQMTAASVAEVIKGINKVCKSAGGVYGGYSCKSVSWDDAARGSVGGILSCWGSNITDTRLYEKGGKPLFTVRSDNWNERLGKVSTKDLALVVGNHTTTDNGRLRPVTLHDFLRDIGQYGAYAGLDPTTNLALPDNDGPGVEHVSIRFQTTFLPIAGDGRGLDAAALASGDGLGRVQFAPEMYNYNTRSDADPRNLLLLCTTQGVAVQQDGRGAKKVFHHALDPDAPPGSAQRLCRYWFEAEQSGHAVGGPQAETAEEMAAAAKRGKATASVIGTREMGTRFNALMTIQVPLQQKPKPQPRHMFSYGAPVPAMCAAPKCAPLQQSWSLSAGSSYDLGGDDMYLSAQGFSMANQSKKCKSARKRCKSAGHKSAGRGRGKGKGGARSDRSRSRDRCTATASAARVSRGTMHDRGWKGVAVKKPARETDKGSMGGTNTGGQGMPITVTVVLYNTVAGGVPSAADVKAAVDDMEQLYASCAWDGRLADGGAGFMKSELTVGSMQEIAAKVHTQPYVPQGVVVSNSAVFPTAAAPVS
jgi:huntingtin